MVANKVDLLDETNFIQKFENTAKLSTYSKYGLDDLKEKMKNIVCNFHLRIRNLSQTNVSKAVLFAVKKV